MAKRVLSKLSVKDVDRALRSFSEKPRRLSDGGGLYLNLRGSGASWAYVTTLSSKQREFTIGSAHTMADASGSVDPLKRAAKSLELARIKAAELRSQKYNGTLVHIEKEVKTNHSIQDIIDYYKKTKNKTDTQLGRYVKPYLDIVGDDDAKAFKRETAVKYMEYLKANVKPATANSYLRMMNSMINLYNNTFELSINNPFSKLSIDDDVDDSEKRESMTIEMIKRMRRRLEVDGDFALIFDLLIVTGARVSEISGLKSSDITSESINIQANDKRRLKNSASRRVIPNPLKLEKRDTEYYFQDIDTNRAIATLSARVRAVAKNPKITTHSLRHTVTDILRDAGINLTLENMFLGHKNSSIAERHYGSTAKRLERMNTEILPLMIDHGKEVGISNMVEIDVSK